MSRVCWSHGGMEKGVLYWCPMLFLATGLVCTSYAVFLDDDDEDMIESFVPALLDFQVSFLGSSWQGLLIYKLIHDILLFDHNCPPRKHGMI